jgi:hypothetical protein
MWVIGGKAGGKETTRKTKMYIGGMYVVAGTRRDRTGLVWLKIRTSGELFRIR